MRDSHEHVCRVQRATVNGGESRRRRLNTVNHSGRMTPLADLTRLMHRRGAALGFAIAMSGLLASCVHQPVGHSREADARAAGRAATKMALRAVAPRDAICALLFESHPVGGERVVQGVRDLIGPGVPIYGCSTGGQISNHGVDLANGTTGSVAVAVLAGTGISFGAEHISSPGDYRTRLLSLVAREDPELILIFVHTKAMAGDGAAALLRAIRDVGQTRPGGLPVIGSIADGRHKRDGRQWLYAGREIHSDGIVAVAISGPVQAFCGAAHSLNKLGSMRKVTAVDGDTIIGLDHRPPSAVIRSESSTRSIAAAPTHVGVCVGTESAARRIAGVSAEGIRLDYPVHVGADIRMLVPRATRMGSIDGDIDALLPVLSEAPRLVVMIGGASRMLKTRYEGHVHQAVLDEVAQGIPVIGFYGGGQFGPVRASNGTLHNQFHQDSVVVVGLK